MAVQMVTDQQHLEEIQIQAMGREYSSQMRKTMRTTNLYRPQVTFLLLFFCSILIKLQNKDRKKIKAGDMDPTTGSLSI